MKTVKIAWTYPKKFSLLSWEIRRIQRRIAKRGDIKDCFSEESSHVLMIFGDIVRETTGGKVQPPKPLSEKLKKFNIICSLEIEVSESDYVSMVAWWNRNQGKKYSYWGAIGSVSGLVRWLGLGKNGEEKFICSESVIDCAIEGEIFTKDDLTKKIDYVNPMDIEIIAEKRNFKVKKGI